MSMTTWSEILPGDVVKTAGLEWFVLDRNDAGDFALLRVGQPPETGRPAAGGEVELRYRGQLGESIGLLRQLGAEVITHDAGA